MSCCHSPVAHNKFGDECPHAYRLVRATEQSLFLCWWRLSQVRPPLCLPVFRFFPKREIGPVERDIGQSIPHRVLSASLQNPIFGQKGRMPDAYKDSVQKSASRA
jgi:hypothetical protein